MFRGGWSTLLSRRAWLAGAGLLGLGGCGFRPLYGPAGGIGDAGVAAELATIRVGLVGERFGQLMRRELQQRLSRGGEGAAVYELRTAPVLVAEGLGYIEDGTTTRVRYIGTANWVLVRLGPAAVPVAQGSERVTEAFNVVQNQFFAVDISRDAAERRIASLLAEEVVTRLAAEFHRRPGLV